MVEERGTALGARCCRYVAVVAGVAVEEVVGVKREAGLVLQELVADAGVQQEAVGVHGIGDVASVDLEDGQDGEVPRLQLVSGCEFRTVVIDVLSCLGCAASL